MRSAGNISKKAFRRIAKDIEYYDHHANWRRLKPHLSSPAVQSQMVKDLNKFTQGRWRKRFESGMIPRDADSCDWHLSIPRSEQRPYWKYACWSACHWVVNFNLLLAQLVEPDRAWRIVSSQSHSTVWDGQNTLFDFNFSALGIPAKEAFERAACNPDSVELPPGKLLKVYRAVHYSHGLR